MLTAFSSPVVRMHASAFETDARPTLLLGPDAKILSVNAAMQGWLRAQANKLPANTPARWPGTPLTYFQPLAVDGLPRNLQEKSTARLRVGEKSFEARFSPLWRDSKFLGVSVDIAGAHPAQKEEDFAGQIAAIHRSQAVIEFAPDGTILTANANFLQALGYRLDEIVGQNHRLFVPPDYAKSAEYRDFWHALRQGTYQAAQFKRFGKNQKPVWIEASYNPIYNADGKLVKIVKYATDISESVAAMGRLKQQMDTSFTQVDQSLGATQDQIHAANDAAQSASKSVQTVAAAADALAESITEITRTMGDSRQATQKAYAETLAIGGATEKLTQAAESMNGIVGIIQTIAHQINLLALNAAIEAARAGDAGRGFAVVASEVKNLANQAAAATQQIGQEIEGMQKTSREVAGNLGLIRDSVRALQDHVGMTAAAVEEQNTVTQDMSAGMQRAAAAVDHITANMGQIAVSISETADTLHQTRAAAQVLAR